MLPRNPEAEGGNLRHMCNPAIPHFRAAGNSNTASAAQRQESFPKLCLPRESGMFAQAFQQQGAKALVSSKRKYPFLLRIQQLHRTPCAYPDLLKLIRSGIKNGIAQACG